MTVQSEDSKNPIKYKKKRKLFRLSPEKSPFFYLLPLILYLAIMVAYPIGRVLFLSFTENILTRPDLGVSFIGLDNYIHLFTSLDFWKTVGRTITWALTSVIGKTVIGFIIALLLSKDISFKRFYMFLLMVPWVTPMVVSAVVWRWLYDGQFGFLNYILTTLHVISEPHVWLGNKLSAFFSTAIVDMWIGIPFMAMMFLAGIQSIPIELHESAKVDGANGLQRLFLIILPLMKPLILVATTLSAIWTFNSFGVIWPMTKGGPVDATQTLIVDAYKRSFGSFDMGMGAAVAIVIFVILLIATIIYRRLLMKQEEI